MTENSPGNQDESACSAARDAYESGCCAGTSVALSTLRRGQRAVVREARLSGKDAELLRAMGLHTDVRVRLCRAGEPCIVAVGSIVGDCGCGSECRIGLARPLADRIFVTVEEVAVA